MGTEDFTNHLYDIVELVPESLSISVLPFFTRLAINSYKCGDYPCCLVSLTLGISFLYVAYRGLLEGYLPKRLEIGTTQE